MGMKRFVTLPALLLTLCVLQAQTPLTRADRAVPSLVAPAFFGPNAFPVPELPDTAAFGKWSLELAAEGFWGFEGDRTTDPFARLRLPLWSDRVSLSLWMPVVEFYRSTEQRLATCRVEEEWHAKALDGHLGGDLYVSTDMLLLREGTVRPSLILRAALKTASGGRFECARYYDSPGYFFDATVGKTFILNSQPPNSELRTPLSLTLAASTGFLCWQTNNGRQNDAVMYGALVRLRMGRISLEEQLAGYSGWEHKGDCPMTLRSRIALHFNRLEPYVMYQYGLRDYPFHHLRVGVAYTLPYGPHQNW